MDRYMASAIRLRSAQEREPGQLNQENLSQNRSFDPHTHDREPRTLDTNTSTCFYGFIFIVWSLCCFRTVIMRKEFVECYQHMFSAVIVVAFLLTLRPDRSVLVAGIQSASL